MLVQSKECGEFAGRNDSGRSSLAQYLGYAGRRRLIDTLVAQPLVQDQDLAAAVALYMKLEEVPAGATLIQQGASDTDLFLILEGAFSVSIDGRILARKEAGEHVGEMAVVDPGTPRSASVIATCDSIVGRIAESDFSALADRYPRLWRRIALELASRLRNNNGGGDSREKAGRAA
jgi:CRP/FNR family transcriptional regulator, cyclic AMP receptor protein